MNIINPMLLLVILILSIGFFVLGLIQLLIRCLIKSPSSPSSISQSNTTSLPEASSPTFQRQLQHLFRSHDSGLDQALIDALPIFYYKDIIVMGLDEPFDCAICLCEFSDGDKLKFLPNCSHAFHIQCIETWLLSNSTCPLCRGLISSTPHRNDQVPKWDLSYDPNGISQGNPSAVLSVRLGKFRRSKEGLAKDIRRDDEVSSNGSRSIDARRCYSMGAFQYIVGDANVRVALSSGNNVRYTKKAFANIEIDGKKIDPRSRGDSFSVSKIWLWSRKGKFPTSLDTNETIVLPMANGSDLV